MKIRTTSNELMDDLASDKGRLFATLRQFKLINLLFTRSRFLVKTLIISHFLRQKKASFTLFDLGAGGCDFALWLSRFLARRGIRACLTCIDNDPRVVEFARAACGGKDGITVIHASALHIDELDIPADYIYSCHLLHHLSDDQVVTLLRKVHAKARLGYVLCDLRRSRTWHFLFGVFSAFFLRNSFSRPDGLLSIRKSFTKAELEGLIARSGIMPQPRVWKLFPGRLVIGRFIDSEEIEYG